MTTHSIELSDATLPLAEYAQHAREQPIVVTDNGRPIAAVVPLPNTDEETLTVGQNATFRAIIERSRVRHAREGGISAAEMRTRFKEDLPSDAADLSRTE